MLGTIAMLMLGTQGQTFGKLHSRAEFRRELAKIDGGWTKEQVENLLGKPDDIIAVDLKRHSATWCYGTNGHGTFPTLGIVRFDAEKVSQPLSFYSIAKAFEKGSISETELRQKIRDVYQLSVQNRAYSSANQCDPLGLIRVANTLIPLGKQGAIGVLGEYYWANPYSAQSHEWTYWLVRALFVPKNSRYVFPVPAIGAFRTAAPTNLSKWPNYPVAMSKDIPITIFTGADGDGSMPLFGIYLQDECVNWEIRKTKLVPPADPFLAYDRTVNSGLMEFARIEDREIIREEILSLVRTAYKPSGMLHYGDAGAKDFEKFHQEFLKLGCRWDSMLDIYVRSDGSYDKKALE